jgi:hypothetical protein
MVLADDEEGDVVSVELIDFRREDLALSVEVMTSPSLAARVGCVALLPDVSDATLPCNDGLLLTALLAS